MKKYILPLFICALLFVGAGCSQNANVNSTQNSNSGNSAVENTNQQNQNGSAQEPVMYGTDMTQEAVNEASEDCDLRGGTLNMCGSACEPDAEVCAAVCALVCEFE